jgi:hypothetical protein
LALADEIGDDSSESDQPTPHDVDPVFNPAPPRSKNTGGTNKSTRVGAVDIDYFFPKLKVEETMKRVCKICG